MKLLFDANISFKLAERLADLFPDSSHVSRESLGQATDEEVWNFAIERDYVIVSKDEDFHQLAFLRGPPPKVVWIRTGNSPTETLEQAIRRNAARIETFGQDSESSFLILGNRAV